ncbi:MAG: GNAT family N-acetyltransferase [Solirubrobacterales bacterium]
MTTSQDRANTPSGWDAVMYRSFAAMVRTFGIGAPDSFVHEADGVVASVCPATPERSVLNSVGYERPDGLSEALDEIARVYDDAGVDAWTVWVPEADHASAELLERAGHLLDSRPEAMLMDLSQLGAPDAGDLEWVHDGPMEDMTTINDAAYGYPAGTFGRALAETPDDAFRRYTAYLDGRAASVLGTLDTDEDCAILWVATLPQAQGRGLSSRLLRLALDEARDRGCVTATLQASPDGRPMYRRVGFQDLGAIHMWERRR